MNTPLLAMLPLFRQHYYFYVLTGNEITHILSYVHTDKVPMKLCLFSLFMELEGGMLNQLTSHWRSIAPEPDPREYLKYLSSGRLKKAQQLCLIKYREETPENVLLCTTLIDRTNVFQKNKTLSKLLTFKSSKEGDRFFTKLEQLRNQIAHGDSILKLIGTPEELDQFVVDLQNLTRSITGSTVNSG